MPRHASYVPYGVIPAVLLPFDNDFAIDEVSFRKHLRDVASVEDNFQINKPINPDSLTASSAAPINLTPKASADGSKLIVGD